LPLRAIWKSAIDVSVIPDLSINVYHTAPSLHANSSIITCLLIIDSRLVFLFT